jgi:hypothetical protein
MKIKITNIEKKMRKMQILYIAMMMMKIKGNYIIMLLSIKNFVNILYYFFFFKFFRLMTIHRIIIGWW